MKFSKSQLDNYSNLCGLVVGVSTVLVAQGWLQQRTGETLIGIAAAIGFYFSNKPALKRPTTEDIEDRVL